MADSKQSSEEHEAERKKLVKLFGATTALTVASGAMLFSARPAIARNLFPDASSLGLFLTRLASIGALFEFIANPVFGKLSDSFGRKALLPIASITVMLVRFNLFLNSTKKWPLVLEQLTTIPIVTSYFTGYRAALADKLNATEIAQANATIGAYVGLSIILGPLAAEVVMRRADPKYCYLMSVAFAGTACTLLLTQFEETLPKSERKELVLSDMQPFSFLQLMKDSVLKKLMLVSWIQSLTEGRSIYDVLSLFLREDVNWDWSKVNRFVGFNGMGLVVGGVAAKPMIETLGMRTFTTVANIANTLNFALYSLTGTLGANSAMIAGSILSWPGARKRDCVEALLTTHASKQGYGRGFISGSMNNFRAIMNIIGPLLFGQAYAWGRKRGMPALPFVIAALSTIIAQLPLATISNKQLGLKEDGSFQKDE